MFQLDTFDVFSYRLQVVKYKTYVVVRCERCRFDSRAKQTLRSKYICFGSRYCGAIMALVVPDTYDTGNPSVAEGLCDYCVLWCVINPNHKMSSYVNVPVTETPHNYVNMQLHKATYIHYQLSYLVFNS